MRRLSTGIRDRIIDGNSEREERTLSPYACKSRDAIRLRPEEERIPDIENIRPSFFHDTDRIIHSNTYIRYIDKTQVFSLFANQHITHRAMHVQYVSKIARTVGRSLLLNEDLIEAIALGHDLGHPPFGHDGESILDDICREQNVGYFAHNVQSVRTLMQLEKRGRGLNMTLQVLDGILAHNGEMLQGEYRPDYTKTKDMFLEELAECMTVENRSTAIVPMTLEGCVVRISDVIGYIGRDIEDALHLNLITRDQIPDAVRAVLGDRNDTIINTLVVDLIEQSYGRDFLTFSPDVYAALSALKKFNYEKIYLNPAIKTESEKIRRMFFMLFDMYYSDLVQENEGSDIYTYFIHDSETPYSEGENRARIVVDFLASMTDEFIIGRFNQLFFPRRYGYFVRDR
ncbi:MAG: deoxyguanosinetriphosphate triphosphohydrolase family protein [Spirochaetota bacterium]